MRKLATIRKIDEIRPIEGADAIVCAVVGGWTVVIRKDEYAVGDLVVFAEIDSWVPTELASFLSKGKSPREFNGVKGERLRTVKLRGQLSQGLILPIPDSFVKVEDMDCTEALGIQKWEAPIPAQLAGVVRGNFPTAVPKTDQERIQNLKKEFDYWKATGASWEVTEKLDGSSCTFFLDLEGEFHVCSRNLDLVRDENNSFWKVAIEHDIEQKMKDNDYFGYALQGELVGEGIQKNIYKLKGQHFFLFDIYNTVEGQYVVPSTRRLIASILKLQHCPVLVRNFIIPEDDDIDRMLKYAEAKSVVGDIEGPEREGLVFKSNTNPAVSWKVISNKFLMKGGD